MPRDLTNFPAFTTNVEFGLLAAQGKAVLGYPAAAPKMKYLAALANRYQVPIFESLEATLIEAVHRTQEPFGNFVRRL